MRGASAHVNGKKIYFRDIISWCQKDSTYDQRQILQRETLPLCKFLKPFALNYWDILLKILKDELGFENYLDYCTQKKGIDYEKYRKLLEEVLRITDELYLNAMDYWSHRRFGLPLAELTRFDAIHLLGLGQFDTLFPEKTMEELAVFFDHWNIDLQNTPGLNLELGREAKKSGQAICFILQVPEEVYVIMKPEGGWVDLETLWHELGHGLSAVFTSPELSMVDRDMATSYSLSESFAFLLQNMALSSPFLEEFMGLNAEHADVISYYKTLKDLSVFRRYAAKFLAEYEMFSSGDLSDGNVYAEYMARYTGFYHQPESHLFDLVPEFYCLDYVLGWMAEAILDEHLRHRLGTRWLFRSETVSVLKNWWKHGNRYDTLQFMEKNGLEPLSPDRLLKRWDRILNSGKGLGSRGQGTGTLPGVMETTETEIPTQPGH
jgi:hypothetical protein